MSQKSAIKADFSRAADNYDSHAGLQKIIAENLVAFIDKIPQHGQILDLGSGTGYMREILQRKDLHEGIIETDIAFPMCKKSRENAGITVNADMERLPFKDGVFSAVVSSLALQWLENLEVTFAEAARVLQPGGIFAFAIFGAGTLRELMESLEKYGEGNRINEFFPAEKILDCLQWNFMLLRHVEENIVNDYRDLFDLQGKIRVIGGRKKGKSAPFGRKKVLCVNEYYSRHYPGSRGIFASWNAHYFLAEKI